MQRSQLGRAKSHLTFLDRQVQQLGAISTSRTPIGIDAGYPVKVFLLGFLFDLSMAVCLLSLVFVNGVCQSDDISGEEKKIRMIVWAPHG